METPLKTTAPKNRPAVLSFKVMQTQALNLISAGCIHKSIRGPRELSIRAGISERIAEMVYNSDKSNSTTETITINGQEWDDLFSAVDVSKESWIDRSFEHNPPQVEESDKVVSLTPEYGASSDGREQFQGTCARIGMVLGYSSAFYLKASDIVLPTTNQFCSK